MKVYVVTWEYPESHNGFVAGVVGVSATPEGGLKLAEAEAAEFLALRDDGARIRIVDAEGEARWYPSDDTAPMSDMDWDLWIEVLDSLEVQP